MKIFLIRLVLSLFILLPSGYSQLYAHTNQSYTHHSSTKLAKNLEQASFASAQNELALITRSASSERKKVRVKLKATQDNEEEEDEHVLVSSKKHSESSNYFSTLFWAQTFNYFFSLNTGFSPVGKHFSYIPSPKRYLIFQVFRI